MPIFKPELIDKILAGQKTQTRRPVKPGDMGQWQHCLACEWVNRNGRRHWEVGKDYALVPGRGKHSIYARLRFDGTYEWQTTQPGGNGGEQWKPMRIRITRIRQEDARDITHADALAEGFQAQHEFLAVWCDFYDGKAHALECFEYNDTDWRQNVVSVDLGRLRQRPDALYQCWALDFELVEVTP